MRHITNSSATKFQRCEKSYEYQSLGIASEGWSGALVCGTGTHAGKEVLDGGGKIGEALDVVLESVDKEAHIKMLGTLVAFDDASADERAECDRANACLTHSRAMIRAYAEYSDPLDIVSSECTITGPVLSGDGKKRRHGWRRAGKFDGLTRDGFILETKTTGDDAAAVAVAYGMEHSPQAWTYLDLLEIGNGVELQGFVVEVLKKPTVQRKKAGKLRDEPEPWANYEDRCVEQILSDIDRFFVRRTYYRDRTKIAEARQFHYDIVGRIRHAERNGFVAAKGPPPTAPCQYCTYRRLCWEGDTDRYTFDADAHPELGLKE